MDLKQDPRRYSTPRRHAYAAGMEIGVRVGGCGLLIAYALYVLGVLKAHVPLEVVVANWDRPAREMRGLFGRVHGETWSGFLHEGDSLNLAIVAYLATVTILCLIRLLPFLAKERDVPMIVITVLQIIILLLAASGLLVDGLVI